MIITYICILPTPSPTQMEVEVEVGATARGDAQKQQQDQAARSSKPNAIIPLLTMAVTSM